MDCDVDFHPECQWPPPHSIHWQFHNRQCSHRQSVSGSHSSVSPQVHRSCAGTHWRLGMMKWIAIAVALHAATSSMRRKRGVLTRWGPQTQVAGLQLTVAALICQNEGDFEARGTRPFVKPPRRENVQAETDVEIRERRIATRRWWRPRGCC